MALPLLVVVTTWAQSKLTLPATPPPANGDQPDQAVAMQQSMTTMMPLMFGFFSLSFSVGISIYFITSNLIGAFQYGILNRLNNQSKPPTDDQVIEEPVKNQKPTKKEALKAKR